MPTIMLQGLVEFRVNCLHLTFSSRFAETWADEKLGKAIQSLLKSWIRAVKVVVSIRQRGVSIVHSSIILHELRVFIF